MVLIEAADFRNSLMDVTQGVTTIKPRVVFEMIEKDFDTTPVMEIAIPSRAIGSITTLEAAILTSFLKLTKPSGIFEFGTFLGYSTALLARNSGTDTQIYSIDLDVGDFDVEALGEIPEEKWRNDWVKNDDYLRQTQLKSGAKYVSELDSTVRQKVRLLTGNSCELDVAKLGLLGQVDFVFVDGGHDFETIKSDTAKSHELIGGNGIIFWHDFNSGLHEEVTEYVKEFSAEAQIFHVESTMLAFLVVGDVAARLAEE